MSMDELIEVMQEGVNAARESSDLETPEGEIIARASRLTFEIRMLLQSLANDEPAPAGHTYQSWAKELLA